MTRSETETQLETTVQITRIKKLTNLSFEYYFEYFWNWRKNTNRAQMRPRDLEWNPYKRKWAHFIYIVWYNAKGTSDKILFLLHVIFFKYKKISIQTIINLSWQHPTAPVMHIIPTNAHVAQIIIALNMMKRLTICRPQHWFNSRAQTSADWLIWSFRI